MKIICITHTLVVFKLLHFCTFTLSPEFLPLLETPSKFSFGMAVWLSVTSLIFCGCVCVKNYDWIPSTDAKQCPFSPVLRLWRTRNSAEGDVENVVAGIWLYTKNCHTVREVWQSAFCGVVSNFFPIPVFLLSGIPAFFRNSNIKTEIRCLSWWTDMECTTPKLLRSAWHFWWSDDTSPVFELSNRWYTTDF